MKDNNQKQYGDEDFIIKKLGIEKYSPEAQAKIINKFGEVLFKKLLLLIPKDVGGAVIDEITKLPLEEGMKRLIELIDKNVPDAKLRRNEILEEVVSKLALPSAKVS